MACHLDSLVCVLADVDGKSPARILFKDEEMLLAYPSGEVAVRMPSLGCFGQEVLLGTRRRETAVARSPIEALILEKAALAKLFQTKECSTPALEAIRGRKDATRTATPDATPIDLTHPPMHLCRPPMPRQV